MGTVSPIQFHLHHPKPKENNQPYIFNLEPQHYWSLPFLVMMETELQTQKKLQWTNLKNSPDIVDNEEEHRYTSLKDIIVNSPPTSALSCEAYDFNPSNIMISNLLVKHAASVYLQSTAILISRNQNWFVRFWENLKNRIASVSCWRFCHVCDPLRALIWALHHFVRYTVGDAFNRLLIRM